MFSLNVLALESDKQADFILDGDNFKNLPAVKDGLTKIKFWGNVVAEQGTLKINADTAVVYSGDKGVTKVVLTGKQVKMEQFIDVEFGKINVKSDTIDFRVQEDILYMTGSVVVKSKVQGEMSGEKISMNLKTKEIKGVKSENKRVKLIIKPKK
jgi:lipopolysaccharide export system protein LptA